MEKQQVLKGITFGESIAEHEKDELSSYFVETQQWQNIFAGNIDIVYGAKGAGKSAIYSLLLDREQELTARRISLIPAENPSEATVFKELADNKPKITERELYNAWKLYFLWLVAGHLDREKILQVKKVTGALEEAGFLPKEKSLGKFLRSAVDYVRRWFEPGAIEAGVNIDPATGAPTPTVKITLREPDAAQQAHGMVSVDELLEHLNRALEESRLSVWVLLDRLDNAFAQSKTLEQKALRALFRVYLDLHALRRIRFKIFLRTDIWRVITRSGFRGASHITRTDTISWDEESLLNLVIRRVLNNQVLQDFYKVGQTEILSSTQKQLELFYRIFPPQIDEGSSNSPTFDWMLVHTRDGLGKTAPRELIQLLSYARACQIKALEVGGKEPEGETLFEASSLNEVLPEVSRMRFEQTLLAEYPSFRRWLERLEGKEIVQTPETLADLWKIDKEKATEIATKLVEVGFFEKRQDSKGQPTFCVPFLYRDALKMIQSTVR